MTPPLNWICFQVSLYSLLTLRLVFTVLVVYVEVQNEVGAVRCSMDNWLRYFSLVYSKVWLERNRNDSRAKKLYSDLSEWLESTQMVMLRVVVCEVKEWSLWNNSNDSGLHLRSSYQVPGSFQSSTSISHLTDSLNYKSKGKNSLTFLWQLMKEYKENKI